MKVVPQCSITIELNGDEAVELNTALMALSWETWKDERGNSFLEELSNAISETGFEPDDTERLELSV